MYVPAAAELLALTARVELPAPGAAIVLGFMLAVTPNGIPLTERVTDELKLPTSAVLTVADPLVPCGMVTDVGLTDSVKSLLVVTPVTVTETFVLTVFVPSKAFTVAVYVPAARVLAGRKVSREEPEPPAM